MDIQQVMEIDKQHFMPVYAGRYPLLVDHGKGIKIYDKDGREIMIFWPVWGLIPWAMATQSI